MITITFLAAILVGATLVSAAGEYDHLCDKTKYDNSATLYKHPKDCSKYVQCWVNALKALESTERQCGFGTYYSEDDMTCISAAQMPCNIDACLPAAMNGKQRAVEGNCRGYWQCKGIKSVPMCCPSGQHYNSTYGCEENVNEECTDDCLGRYVAPIVSTNDTDSENTTDATTTEAPIMCDKVKVANEPSRYLWNVNGWSYPMNCPSGTVFVQKHCDCLISDAAVRTCKPELLLTFNNGFLDESRNKIEVTNISVMVENGEAVFDGSTSKLVIPFFTSMDIKNTLIVRMKYTSDHTEIPVGEERALFSNFDCGRQPSIQLTESSHNLTALVGTMKQFETRVTVLQTPLAVNETVSEKDVMYKFHDNQLSLTVGTDVEIIPTEGKLRKIHCALHIGYASGMPNFKGRIDELAVYQCEPEA